MFFPRLPLLRIFYIYFNYIITLFNQRANNDHKHLQNTIDLGKFANIAKLHLKKKHTLYNNISQNIIQKHTYDTSK